MKWLIGQGVDFITTDEAVKPGKRYCNKDRT